MGVFASFCQVCALPLQHTCYVPHEGMYFIYRGPDSGFEGSPTPGFPFGPEHEWLRQAVALRFDPSEEPVVYRGEVQDGELIEGEIGVDVEDGLGDRIGLHARCWELSGRAEWSALSEICKSEGWREVSAFHGQLFEFDELLAAGHAWWTVDPDASTPEGQRSRARILSLLGREGR